ncbi:MAG: shikimate kinase [Deltaproteobacteria bacterium]|nr:MAG: shikimate kinase [Deltaproteobacteria bacterium]
MPGFDNIVLVGFMGCGKSTVAAELAGRCAWQYVDLDEVIVSQAGRSIPVIFAEDGEDTFRRLETEALRGLVGRRGLVVAAGGGIVLRRENWNLMRQLGPVVFLQTDPGVIRSRLQGPSGRPLADGQSWADILAHYQQRLPFYRQADVTVELTDESPEEIAGIVLRAIENGLNGKNG